MIATHLQDVPPRYRYLFNTGGPHSRTRTERVSSTVLGNKYGFLRCRKVIRIGIDFENRAPLPALYELLAGQGLSDPEELRRSFPVLSRRLICREDRWPEPLSISKAPITKLLEQAFMLGLCTPMVYDPARPVLWTAGSVKRRLELFDPEEYYIERTTHEPYTL